MSVPKRAIDSIDYEEYEFALFLGQTEASASKKMCHDFKETATYGQPISIRMRKYMVLIVKRQLPEEIRLIVVSMLIDLYRTSPEPMLRVPRGIINSIKREYEYSAFSWNNLHVAENSIYSPLCRGYCYYCGEPQHATNSHKRANKIVLNRYRLTIMVLCYCCIADGFSFDLQNRDFKTVIVPTVIYNRKITF